VARASIVALRQGPFSTAFGKPKLPRDFPIWLEPYLVNHYAQLLNAGESPASAWESLHQVAVEAGLAWPYLTAFGAAPSSNEEAVEGGLASTEGWSGAEEDLVDYMERAAVPEGWSFGPCAALRAAPLDELSPPLLVHAAKLLALYGLGLLERGALTACVDVLRVGSSDERKQGALIFYKPDAERLILTEELEGIRQPYFSGEVQLSWKAQRSYLTASLSVGYRSLRPTVMRLQAVAGNEGRDFRSGEDSGAVLAFTNPDGYQTSVVLGGLLVVTDVQRDALKAYALMAVLKEPIAGTKIFPLVSAQVTKPTWGDAP
jgi:hypothetical protein